MTMNLKQETIKRAVFAFLGTAFISAFTAIAINNNIILPLGNTFLLLISHGEILLLLPIIIIMLFLRLQQHCHYIY